MGFIVGVDEVGRGSLAGPLLVVAARQTGDLPNGLRDSKLLTRNQRLKLLTPLSNCCEFGEGWVNASEIDRLGLARALKLGVKRALEQIRAEPGDEIIMDGKVNYISKKFKRARCVIGGDTLIPVISAASIYAKVTRDNYMIALSKKHPQYQFERHVGYATQAHITAIAAYGVLGRIHRMSFTPVSKLAVIEA